MAATTLTDLRLMLGDAISSIPDATLNFYLDQSYIIVENEGVDNSHYKFSILQLYKTAHLLFMNNFIKGDVMSEAVADVSVSYGGVSAGDLSSSKYSSKWDKIYHQVRITVIGMCDRIL